MSLIVYECQRAGHGHEIRQFSAAAQSLYDYFDGRDETALFIANINVGEANLYGLIVKNDAIIIVEFKDYEGDLRARQNGDWTCNGKAIKGGNGGKSVYEQLRKNQRILRKVIAENGYFSEAQRSDIKDLVVLTKLKSYSDDFDRSNKAWVFVSDVESIGNKMHDIVSADFRNPLTGHTTEVDFSDEDIFNFLRKIKIDESALVTDFTDTTILPPDLYDKSHAHNGKHYSTATLLAKKTEEANSLKTQIEELLSQIDTLKVEHQKEVNEKELLINQQKAEILQALADKLEADKAALEAQSKVEQLTLQLEGTKIVTPEQIESEEKLIVEQIAEISQNIQEENILISSVEESLNTSENTEKSKKKRFGLKERVLKEFNVGEDSLDAEQIGLIERELEKSMIVSGCAGSGKSVIAMYKAQQIIEEGGDVILIAYTKSLNRYMQQGKAIPSADRCFYYHWQWVDAGMPSADYIIVDEIQDFSREEVTDFIRAAKKCFFFFGDTAQSIYEGIKHPMTIKELSEMTDVPISYLNSNYRLPKPVAKVTQDYVAVDANPYAEAIYQSKETDLPRFVNFDSDDSQIDAIINIINKKKLRNVGILVPSNELVLSLMNSFSERNFICEFKYNAGFNDSRNKVKLDFMSTVPKLMTYHSAKGLQFETVILPFFEGAKDKDSRKALYVAMTRTYRFLYVMFSNNTLPAPLDRVPEHLYLKEL
jgi:Superfamily I DNA and RNA helicases